MLTLLDEHVFKRIRIEARDRYMADEQKISGKKTDYAWTHVEHVFVGFKHEGLVNARTLTIQTAHFLGFKMGDSIIWKEQNPYSGKVETHWLCFDKSGLDMSHLKDSAKLVEMRIESGLKGVELLTTFANKYSLEGYLQHYRGNKLLSTSEPKNALKDYLKHYPLAQTI